MYVCLFVCTFVRTYVYVCIRISVFDKLIWHTIGPKNFLFGTAQFSLWASGAVNYDYIITNSLVNWLKMYSQCRTH